MWNLFRQLNRILQHASISHCRSKLRYCCESIPLDCNQFFKPQIWPLTSGLRHYSYDSKESTCRATCFAKRVKRTTKLTHYQVLYTLFSALYLNLESYKFQKVNNLLLIKFKWDNLPSCQITSNKHINCFLQARVSLRTSHDPTRVLFPADFSDPSNHKWIELKISNDLKLYPVVVIELNSRKKFFFFVARFETAT